MNLESHYFCELCSEILVDPVFHQCCSNQYDDEKLFCRDCLENYYELNDARGVEGPFKQTLKPCDCAFKRCVEPGKVVRMGSGPHGGSKSFKQVRALALLDTLRSEFPCRRRGCDFVGKNHHELMKHISSDCMYTKIHCPFKGCDTLHYAYIINGSLAIVSRVRVVRQVRRCGGKHRLGETRPTALVDLRASTVHAICAAYGTDPPHRSNVICLA